MIYSWVRQFYKVFLRWLDLYPARVLLLASLLIIFGSFGLRNIILTPLVENITRAYFILALLETTYWAALVLGLVLTGIYIWQNSWFESLKTNWKHLLAWFVFSIPYFYLLLSRRLVLDFWLDEVMSIVRHIEPSIGSAALWYPVPNNHVLSNIITNIYARLIGLDTLREIFINPIYLRMLFLFFAIATVLAAGRTATYLTGRLGGWIAVILLTTTVPFLNFSVQVRGYPLSFLSATLLFYFTLRYIRSHKRDYAIWLSFLSFILFYTIPLNLYYLLATIFPFGVKFAHDLQHGRWKSKSLNADRFILASENLTVVLMILSGIIIAIGAYLPIFDKVFESRYVETAGYFNGSVFADALPNSVIYFSSNRELLLIIGLLGIIWGLVRAIRDRAWKVLDFLFLGLSICVLPFIISFIRGDNPFERVFINIIPVLMILIAYGFTVFLDEIKKQTSNQPIFHRLFVLILGIIPLIIFLNTYADIEDEIYKNLAEEKVKQVELYDQTLWASHFLEHYQVLPVIIEADEAARNGKPIYVDLENTRFVWVITEYLDAFEVPHKGIETPNDIDNANGLVVVSYANQAIQLYKEHYPFTDCQILPLELSIYRVLDCKFHPDS